MIFFFVLPQSHLAFLWLILFLSLYFILINCLLASKRGEEESYYSLQFGVTYFKLKSTKQKGLSGELAC